MRELRRVLAAIAIGVAALLSSGPAAAATLYQIDIIVFGRPGGGHAEQSATGSGLAYPLRLALLQTAPADASSVGPWQLLPTTARALNDEAAALSRRGFPILFQGAWRQPVDTATRATSVALAGGRSVGAHHELAGYVTLSAENYLHLYVNLWLSQFGPNPPAGDTITLPVPGGAFEQPSDAPAIETLFVLRQHRRLRSGELHYFDHPRFSALVTVRPIEQ